MRWDYRLVSYSLLIYFIYGVINLLDLNDFVVPLPLSFIFTIIISLVFILRTKLSINTALFLGIPLIVLKDLFINYNELIGVTFIILSLSSWVTLGLLLIKQAKENTLIKITGILMLFAPILLINSITLSLTFLITLLFFSIKIIQTKHLELNIPVERSLLTLCFIIALYLINETSVLLVNL